MSAEAAIRVVELHPFAPRQRGAVRSLRVHVESGGTESLHLRYVLHGDLHGTRIPSPAPSRQAHELWKHTCFEAFLRARNGTAYHELNVSPSTEWALYAFSGYRAGMTALALSQPPEVRVDRSADCLTVDVQLGLKELPAPGVLALAAVIEEESGSLSYWALKHPAANPDFHHPDSFVLAL